MWLSSKLDLLLPAYMRIDGNSHFVHEFAPPYLKADLVVFDIGGGKNPFIDLETKARLNLYVVGLDIDANELAQATQGAYDECVCADIQSYRGSATADLVICQSLLEHVADVGLTFDAITSVLKPGGIAVVFVPSRNAVFARLNLLLPESTKRWLLFTIFPATRRSQGFRSYYNQCTPAGFARVAQHRGLSILEKRLYYMSNYFSFFAPLYFLWRVWIVTFYSLAGDKAAETFSMAFKMLEKPK